MTTGSNEELRGLIARILDVGCNCDAMFGYFCGIHSLVSQLEAALPKSSPAPTMSTKTAEDNICVVTDGMPKWYPRTVNQAQPVAKSSPDALREAAKKLAEACAADFEEPTCEDEEKVSYPEKDCHITFGHIRNVFRALAAPSSPIEGLRRVLLLIPQWELLAKCSRSYEKLCVESGDKVLEEGWKRQAETQEYHARQLREALAPQVGPVSPEDKQP